MSLLLDTHVVLWWLTDDVALHDEVKARLDDDPDVFVSAATVWELAIKQALGKLAGPADLPELVVDSGLRPLPITAQHAMTAGRLPPLHRDPFDRVLVAQTQCEGLTLATRDATIQAYEVDVLRV